MDGTPSAAVERVRRLLQPIATDARGGTDARLGDHFDRIQAEISKLSGAAEPEIDWRLVTERSEALLVAEAKDVRVAVYLALAWYRGEGLVGLQRGFDLLAGLLDQFWQDAFPPLAKVAARADVITWLSERLRTDLVSVLARSSSEQLSAVIDAFVRMRAVIRARFPDRPPALLPVESAFESLPPELRSKLSAPSSAPSTTADTPATEGDEILRPIPGDDPGGADPSLVDDFEAIRVEITKVGGIAGEDANWPKVLTLSRKILRERAKDLRCVVYLAVARYRVEGGAGLRDGIVALGQFAERFAETMHPRRTKGRVGALTWLGERMQGELIRHPPSITADELTELRAAVVAAKKLTDPISDGCSALSVLDEALAKVKTKASAKPAQPVAAAPSSAPAAASTAPSAGVPASVPTVDPELESIAHALLGELRTRTASGREDAMSLRLRRLALWLTLPPSLGSKKYDCETGTQAQRGELAALAKAENWAELLHNCEVAFAESPFWLDLTFFSIQAAEQVVGKEAALALRSELVALLVRNPTLASSFDRKGQWLASKEMRDWISRELTMRPPPAVVPAADATPAPVTAAAAPAGAPVAAPVADPDTVLAKDVIELIRQKKTTEALALAEPWLAGATNPRARFIRTLTLAQTCLSVGDARIAFPLFRALEGQLRTATLAQLEPQLAVACIRGYLQTKRDAGMNLAPGDERLVDELALLDPKALTGLFR